MLKHLGLATAAAVQAGQPVPMGETGQRLYRSWSSQGAGTLDFSSIIKLVKQCA